MSKQNLKGLGEALDKEKPHGEKSEKYRIETWLPFSAYEKIRLVAKTQPQFNVTVNECGEKEGDQILVLMRFYGVSRPHFYRNLIQLMVVALHD